jgi:exodeoxyribonuclease VII small subunit
MKSKDEQKPGFEQSLSELEELVVKLESGDLSLDQSLQNFKRGVELTRHCQTILDDAQQTVELLTQTNSSHAQNDSDDDNN